MEKRGWRIDNTLCFAHHSKNVRKSVVTVGQGACVVVSRSLEL